MDSPNARFGIMASGKSYEDIRQALRELGITPEVAAKIGLRLYKIGMPWPLEPQGVRKFAVGLEEIFIVEERREIVENQVKQELFNWRDDVRPRIVGKMDEHDKRFLPFAEELSVASLASSLTERLLRLNLNPEVAAMLRAKADWFNGRQATQMQAVAPITRTPYFCSGCPHNTSTKVPQGSRAFAGIGCHFMALWMDRSTETFTHMGGEGVPWVGVAPFTDEKHVFANLGDGTYFHSGSLAIRQAVASKANITYKILYNDATAMTGGQHVDGDLSPQQVTFQLHSEGIRDIYLVSETPEAYPASEIAPGTKTAHRDELDAVMKTCREIKGASAIVFVQTCAAEKRRRRKRGTLEDPQRRVLINPAVCEGCGDCSVQSNCISVEPLETEMGRKRTINQSSCNKDYSCLKGFCPSFVTVDGGKLRRRAPADLGNIGDLPEPASRPSLDKPYNVAVGGVGGTGVLTIGALLGMAAHIEGKASMILDMSGLAQKGGAVLSHVRLSQNPADVTSSRIVTGTADLVIAADEVVAIAKETITLCESSRTHGVINTHLIPIADFILNRDFNFQSGKVNHVLETALRKDSSFFDFTKPAETLLGDSIATNMMMMGYAYQKGLLPLTAASIEQAIEINGVAIKMNTQAFQLGRLAAADPARLAAMMKGQDETVAPKTLDEMTLDEVIAHRSAYPDRLSEFAAGETLSHIGGQGAAAIGGRIRRRPRARGRDQLRKTARLQGRIRGGAAVHRRPVRKAAQGPVRRRLHLQLPPRAAAVAVRERSPRPAEEKDVRAVDDEGVPGAGGIAVRPRHAARPVRPQRRAQDGARPDRGLREGRRLRAGKAVAAEYRHRGRTAVAAGPHPRLRPGQGQVGRGRQNPLRGISQGPGQSAAGATADRGGVDSVSVIVQRVPCERCAAEPSRTPVSTRSRSRRGDDECCSRPGHGLSLRSALAKPVLTGHKNRWEETPAESCIDDQGQGLHRRDLRASDPACTR